MHAEKQLIEAFTGKSHLQDSSDSEWAALTAQYPAFTLGHYFRAKRQLANTENGSAAVAADKDVQKSLVRYSAAKHFNDVLWLDYLLKHDFKQQKEDTTADKAPVMEAQAAKQAHDPSYTLQSLGNTAAEAKDKIVMPTAAHTDKKNHQGAGITQNQVAGDLKKEAPQAATDEAAATDDTVMDDTVTDDIAGDNSRLTAVLTAQLADFKKPLAANARLEVQREPLYKVDYFAFQGISIVKSQDGLDKKVRKFTDWLKEMKQQTPDNSGIPQLNTTPQEEAQAAKKAAASLKIQPVWTESMAEVLINQGKSVQAREVYQKLSLLYPEKSAYFASKIDLLQ